MKASCIYMVYSDEASKYLPIRTKKRKITNRHDDMEYSLNQADKHLTVKCEAGVLTIKEMSSSQIKSSSKDKKKIKDVVMVKSLNLQRKEITEPKRTPTAFKIVNRASLNFLQTPTPHSINGKQKMKLFRKNTSAIFDNSIIENSYPTLYVQNRKENRPQNAIQKKQQGFLLQGLYSPSCKTEDLINSKLSAYLNTVKYTRKLYNLSEQLKMSRSKKSALRVRIKKGNNSRLVRWLFKKRWWWSIQQDSDKEKGKVNFIWSQLKDKQYFSKQYQQKQDENSEPFSHNHFSQNQYLGNKKALFYNMSYYCKKNNSNVFDTLPLTFHVVNYGDESWNNFTQKFEDNKKNNKTNIWIVKPGENSNRGKGITIHSSFQEIREIVRCGESGSENEEVKNRTNIIQLYIDRPLLYNKRKFDIRCYMLLVNINKQLKGYWYHDGYIRTSSFEFQLNDFDTFVHLTNDAIQTHCQSYGKYEEGNKISYPQFQKYLDAKFANSKINLQKQILPKLKEISLDSIKATAHLLKGEHEQCPVFEIFGLDFMIDDEFKPWLIEINTNPCLETSCLTLQKIIPKMLDDAFKLSLDVLFSPPQIWPSSRKHCVPSVSNKFQLFFQEKTYEPLGTIKADLSQLGIITEDEQIYEQK